MIKFYQYFLWEFLKSSTRYANTDIRKKKFFEFIQNHFLDIIPDDKLKNEIKKMMEDTESLELFMNDNNLLEWLFRVKEDLTDEVALKPSAFGPIYWKILFSAAFCANTPEKRQNFRYLVLNLLTYLIPCKLCSEHWIENLRNGPNIDNFMDNNIELMRWLYEMKKIVDSPSHPPSFDEVVKRYNN